MKAIILASGIGKRLRPLTNDLPKPLVKINEKTILDYQLELLKKCGIKNVIITTGHLEDKIKKHVSEKYKEFDFSFVYNPQYDSTNYIYSLWLTKDLIDDDIILFHGDLVFTKKLLSDLIKKNGNRVAIDKELKLPEKDFKAVIKNEKIEKIGIDFFGENAFFCLPLYKFTKNDFISWLNEMEEEIKRGNINIYAENAFNNISDKINLKPLYYNDETCMEIDTIEDLNKVKKMIK